MGRAWGRAAGRGCLASEDRDVPEEATRAVVGKRGCAGSSRETGPPPPSPRNHANKNKKHKVDVGMGREGSEVATRGGETHGARGGGGH